MITLVELGVVFWVGAQLWMTFVFELAEARDQEQRTLDREVAQRFERLFSIPTLLHLLLANVGILIGQALVVTSGQWLPALAPPLLSKLITSTIFGTYWILREIVIALALVLAIGLILFKQRPRFLMAAHPWINLVLGLVLLAAMTLSGHAAAVDDNLVVSSVLVDWLHLLAASLWVGGMFYLATTYLPVLQGKPLKEQVSALLITLQRYSPLAITGVILMAVSGPSNAVVHISSWEQLFTTVYGRTLVLKVLLVVGMLFTSAVHVFLFRPQLKKAYQKYAEALEVTQRMTKTASPRLPSFAAQQVKALEGRVQKQTSRLTRILRWEPLLGVAVLICTGFLNIFAGTLQPVAASQPGGASMQQLQVRAKPAVKTVKTTDGLFTVTLSVSPNHQGPNVFTVRALNKLGTRETAISVSIDTTLPGMDMGTNTVNLQPDGKGNFSGSGNFSMSGNWRLHIEIRTPDNTLHDAQIEVSPT